MSARSLARRSRLLSAIALSVATGAAVLAPATAFASPSAATPPAPPAAKPLTAKLSAPSKITPLTRGGDTEEMTLTVTNDSDQPQPFHPYLAVTNTGPALNMTSLSFSARAIDAPPTWGTATWSSAGAGGYVLPDHRMNDIPFTVPAHQTYTWSVSVGATTYTPADDTALTYTLTNDAANSTNLGSVTFPIAPPAPPAAKPLTAKLSAPSKITPLTRGGDTEEMTLTVTNDSDQPQPFHPYLAVTNTGPALNMTSLSFSARAIDAPPTWGTATWSSAGAGGYVLPDHRMNDIPFTVPAHQTYTWSVSVGATTYTPADDTALTYTLTNDAANSTNLGSVTFPIAPSTTAGGGGSTTGQGASTTNQGGSTTNQGASTTNQGGSTTNQGASAAKPAGVAAPAAMVAPAAVAGVPVATTLTSDTTAPAAHDLAFTGGGSDAVPLVGAGGTLVVLGAGAVLYSQRRRAAAQD
ncbi:hypothetical protein OG500_17280 [Kitasatospora sp. NBC_01250]|uniref:hypothetical protein n=1 Tax=Kitasatospora sp. NBC_01250 TaxID=2903571 RepID=UPI002E371BCA|nr:hypothetical protein [Kitasatospora sp. NBC_01250]